MMEDEDPGWRFSPRTVLRVLGLGLLPFVGVRLASRRADVLVAVRDVFLVYCASLAEIGVVVSRVVRITAGGASVIWVAGIACIATVEFVMVPRIEQPLPCDSLAGAYRTRFFLRTAFALSPAMFGFTAAFIVNAAWVYYACLVFTGILLARAAPTRRAIQRDQQELTNQGCGLSLVAALRGGPYTRPTPEG